MARIRSIHPDACDSRKLGAMTGDAERLYWRLQTHCDDEGRCEDDPRLIWARCCPHITGWDDTTVDGLLHELHEAGLIRRYQTAGKNVIEVAQWGVYQHPKRPSASKLPPLSDTDTPHGDTCSPHVPHMFPTARPHVSPGVGGERSGVEGECEGEPTVTPPAHPTPVDNRDDDGIGIAAKIAMARASRLGRLAPTPRWLESVARSLDRERVDQLAAQGLTPTQIDVELDRPPLPPHPFDSTASAERARMASAAVWVDPDVGEAPVLSPVGNAAAARAARQQIRSIEPKGAA